MDLNNKIVLPVMILAIVACTATVIWVSWPNQEGAQNSLVANQPAKNYPGVSREITVSVDEVASDIIKAISDENVTLTQENEEIGLAKAEDGTFNDYLTIYEDKDL